MVIIPAYQPGVTLFHRSGQSWHYPSLKAALKTLGYRWISDNVSSEFRTAEPSLSGLVMREHEYVMRNDVGEVITAGDFYELARKRVRPWWYPRHDYCGYGPVPGSGRCHNGHYFRRLRTINERRSAALVVAEEGEVEPRAKRSVSNIPNSWDDFGISAREDRNWKRHRKTQWKS